MPRFLSTVTDILNLFLTLLDSETSRVLNTTTEGITVPTM